MSLTIGSCSGILKVKNDVLRHYGPNAVRNYRLKVQLKDADDNEPTFNNGNQCSSATGYCQKTVEAYVDVKIQNRNDPPIANVDDNTFVIGELADLGASIGSIKFTDEDAEDTHVFRISQIDDHDAIIIDPSNGELKVLRRLNYESKTMYTLKVVITDSGGWRRIPLSAETSVIININNENDPRYN